jgi:hypothetical protein
MALRSPAAHIPPVMPHMRPTMHPEAACWVRAFGSECAGCLRMWWPMAALDRARQHLPTCCIQREEGSKRFRCVPWLRRIQRRERSHFAGHAFCATEQGPLNACKLWLSRSRASGNAASGDCEEDVEREEES